MATTNVTIRMDTELKKQADAMLSGMGMNMTTAMNIFLRQVVRQGRILIFKFFPLILSKSVISCMILFLDILCQILYTKVMPNKIKLNINVIGQYVFLSFGKNACSNLAYWFYDCMLILFGDKRSYVFFVRSFG